MVVMEDVREGARVGSSVVEPHKKHQQRHLAPAQTVNHLQSLVAPQYIDKQSYKIWMVLYEHCIIDDKLQMCKEIED